VSAPRPGRLLVAVRRAVIAFLSVVAGLYALAVLAAFLFQRSMLYFPDPREIAPDPAGPPMQVVRITTADHQTLVAWWLPPASGKPTLLYFGGNGDSLAGGAERWRLISKEGVGVLAVGYRGYSGSTGHPTEAGLTQDANAAYAWVAARYRPEQVIIHGFSLGTGVAVRLAVDHPARALILEAPFTSAVDVAAWRYPWLPARLLTWDRYPSASRIAKIHIPLLVVHGDHDSVIPYAFGRRLYGLANAPKRFVTIPGGDHNTLVRDGLYDHVWAFLGLSPEPAAS
jgi:fermentation-respiration switch protein FrsA (DUF1100 family)